MNIEGVEILNGDILLYSYNYKNDTFHDNVNKKLINPITTKEQFAMLLKTILDNNIETSLTFNNNKLQCKITNYKEVSELYELDKYVAKNFNYNTIVEFITNSTNEQIIDYIEKVDNLKYEYYELSKPMKLLDIIFHHNKNYDLVSYILEHKYNVEYYHFNSLLKLLITMEFENMVKLTLKCPPECYVFGLINVLFLANDNLTIQEQIIQDDANLLFSYERRYEMFNHLLMNTPNTLDIYSYLRQHIFYLRNTTQNIEIHNAMNYIKNTNLISMMYDKNINMVVADKIVDFNKIYFLKTNNMKIVKKCKNLVYLEYENDDIDGISDVEHISNFYKFKNCKISCELLTYLFTIEKNIYIDIIFQNCIIDEYIIDKLKSIQNYTFNDEKCVNIEII